jgi:UDP-N-acetylmuramoyl-tripeptide--D-alanyl-D-alanine ligase
MMRASEAARKLGVALLNGDATFNAVSTDSRRVGKGELFVALKGENFDGHAYVAQAAAQGAVAAIVSHEVKTVSVLPQIIVGDTPARAWCRHANTVLATAGNLNNNIGVPQMMLRLNAQHRYAVFEMGMNHLEEIDYLTRLVEPDVALINMAGTAHIGELGSREAIAQAKGEIFAGLGATGVACVNADDRFADYWRGLVGERSVVNFGIEFAKESANELAPEVCGVLTEQGVKITAGGASCDLALHVVGEHNRRNAIAAAAAAFAIGIPLETIAEGLEDFEGVAGRLRTYHGFKEATIIDDTYNANPDSVRAAIDVLAKRPGMRYLVLGDMGELGVGAKAMHAEIGDYAKHAKLDGLFAIGELTEATVMALGATGWHFDSVDELTAEIDQRLAPNATVLVKGSRFMKMERVVEKLVPNFHGAH